MLRRSVLVIAALIVACPAWADDAPDLSGIYRMEGKGFGPNDSAYEGSCTLTFRDAIYHHGAVYEVSCFNEDTRHTYVGEGLASGDRLAIFIGDVLKGDHNAVFAGEYLVLYERQADGSFSGTWLHAQGPAAGAETLKPMN